MVNETIMAAGALLPLIRLLESSSQEVQQEAILVLMLFTQSKNFATLILAANAIPVLAKFLRSTDEMTAILATTMLKFLAWAVRKGQNGRSEVHSAFKRDGVLSTLARVPCSCGNFSAASEILSIMQALDADDEEIPAPEAAAGLSSRQPPSASAGLSSASTSCCLQSPTTTTAAARVVISPSEDSRQHLKSVCVLQSNEAPKGRMRPKPKGQLNSKEQPTSKSEFPPGQIVLYPKGRGPNILV